MNPVQADLHGVAIVGKIQFESSGQLVSASPLPSVETVICVRLRDGKRLITDGPFAETAQQMGGYSSIDVENLDQAMAMVASLPPARKGTVEIRPLMTLPE